MSSEFLKSGQYICGGQVVARLWEQSKLAGHSFQPCQIDVVVSTQNAVASVQCMVRVFANSVKRLFRSATASLRRLAVKGRRHCKVRKVESAALLDL